jgi:hypothetical protein
VGGVQGRVEPPQGGEHVPKIAIAAHERVAVSPGPLLLVGERVHLHIGAHEQTVLGLVELVTGPELQPGDGELEQRVTGFVVGGQSVADAADGDLWVGRRGFGRCRLGRGRLGGRRP